MQMWNWRGLDVINAHERDPRIYLRGMQEAIEAVRQGRLSPAALYTHRFSLDQLDEALNATRDRPDGFMKALIVMHDATTEQEHMHAAEAVGERSAGA